MSLRCLFCDQGPSEGAALFRVSAKGKPPAWVCEAHLRQTDAHVDPELRKLSEILRGSE